MSENKHIPLVYLDALPLGTGHASRGIGTYTRQLLAALSLSSAIKISTDPMDIPKADIIHFPYFDIFYPTLRIKRTKKTVITIHDLIPLEFPNYYKPGVRGKMAFLYQKNLIRFADAVITDSEYSKNQIIEKLHLPKEKIFVTYLAADSKLQQQSIENITTVKKQYNLPENYVLYVGDINYNKNLPQLIKSLKYLPDYINLVCVGKNFRPQEIPEWQWIESQIAMSDVSKRVQFVTDVPHSDPSVLAAIYSGATVYVQPSLSEGFGLPLLEAMQCKCPVISTRLGSLPEVGEETVLYTEPEAEALAQSIETVYAWSKMKREKIIDTAYTWSKHFSWYKTAEQTIEVYKKLLKGNGESN